MAQRDEVHRSQLETTRRNWRWAIVAVAVVAFSVGRQSAPDASPIQDRLTRAEELQRSTDTELYDLWNNYADLADEVGRSDLADEVRAQYEPQREDFTEYP